MYTNNSFNTNSININNSILGGNNNINLNNMNDHGLGRIDSSSFFQLGGSSSFRMTDIFGLDKICSLGRSNSRFGLDRQPTSMSQMSVGGFKMQKDIAINQNGDVIVQTLFDPTQMNNLSGFNGINLNHLNNNNNNNNNNHTNNLDFMAEIDNLIMNNNNTQINNPTAGQTAVNVSKSIDSSTMMKIGGSSDSENKQSQKNSQNDVPDLGLMHDALFQMTTSEVVDPQQKSFYNKFATHSFMGKSINSDAYNLFNESVQNKQPSIISLNLTQFQNEANMYKYFNEGTSGGVMASDIGLGAVAMSMNPSLAQASNFIFPMSLIEKKIETHSEPDIDVQNYASKFAVDDEIIRNSKAHVASNGQNQHSHQNGGGMHMNFNGMKASASIYNNYNNFDGIHNNNNNNNNINAYNYSAAGYQQQEQSTHYAEDIAQIKNYAHSDDEGGVQKESRRKKRESKLIATNAAAAVVNAASNPATEEAQQGAANAKPPKGPQYRQSRHKNVFKNFGGTLIRFIVYNEYFQNRVIEELQRDAQKQKAFQSWLQNNVKLERKKDFQIAWTTFKTDSQTIREFKALLRELSKDFFENFSFIYLMNSKKISDMEIHLRSIHTYLAAINQPDSLERFKPV